ncbi:beta-ketoacyl-ACP synthase III [Mangrovihabitans endophyticus]|uniref:Beta-ketoacyl-[acyl-carrier-protein] synthase III n=1 Tax=Mangrovihabitans endophyticus TaxID=1751298 RepID=A0A8J3BZX9_9ACTN|nr:beta-ketoacyl-ACP synthase III [Mangrovihabitans endophyticus]GGK86805.1 3-oxoacyl-[acyl-carrier-protein] synthase 3 protein 4 [Mangrovihabitans endophyticus]
MAGSRIVSLGHYQPSRVLTNDDLAGMVDTNDEWIRSRVGIKTRHIAAPDESLDEMAAHAARKALAESGVEAADIDYVIVATCTAFDRSPNIAARVARRLEMAAPAALDLNVACSGFTHALASADQAIKTGAATRALIIGVERLSDFTDWTDRSTCVLIGDGAGAMVLVADEAEHVGPVVWGSVPEMSQVVRIEGRDAKFEQEGQSVFRWATHALPAIARSVCEKAGVRPEDLAAVVPHQANLRIIEPLARRIGATNAVIARDVIDSGNTSAASIPIALSKLVMRREVPSGAPILLFGFGGGLSYAGQVVHCP